MQEYRLQLNALNVGKFPFSKLPQTEWQTERYGWDAWQWLNGISKTATKTLLGHAADQQCPAYAPVAAWPDEVN